MTSNLIRHIDKRGNMARVAVLSLIVLLIAGTLVGWKTWVVTRQALILTACFTTLSV